MASIMSTTNSDAHSRNLKTNSRLSVILITRTFVVVLARSLVMRITVLLNNHGAMVMLFPATAVLVTNRSDVLDATINNGRGAIGEGGSLRRAYEQAGSANQKRNCKFVHIHSSGVSLVS
jgi:hypothetical protein